MQVLVRVTLDSSLRGAQATKQSTFACRVGVPSLRGANGSRECAPYDRLRDEAIHFCPCGSMDCFASLAMTGRTLYSVAAVPAATGRKFAKSQPRPGAASSSCLV